ncbi:MAG: cation transporter [Candidatus Zixiibacteriota bacterium]
MRKLISLTAVFIFVFAIAFAGISYAGDGPGCSAKASCDAKTSLTKAGTDAACDSKASLTKAGTDAAGDAKTDGMTTKKCGPDCTKPCCSSDKGLMGSATNAKSDMTFATAKFSVNGMTCAGCESQVSQKLAAQDGVSEVIEVNHNNSTAVFKYNPEKINPAKLAEMVTQMGYKAEVVSTGVDMAKGKVEDKTKTM